MDNYSRISLKLIDILGGDQKETNYAWGCTSYMDMRIILVLNYMRNKRKLTPQNLQQLSDLYEDFLACMVEHDGTYQLYGGTYKLLHPVQTVRQSFTQAALLLTAKASKPSWAAWLSWSSRMSTHTTQHNI